MLELKQVITKKENLHTDRSHYHPRSDWQKWHIRARLCPGCRWQRTLPPSVSSQSSLITSALFRRPWSSSHTPGGLCLSPANGYSLSGWLTWWESLDTSKKDQEWKEESHFRVCLAFTTKLYFVGNFCTIHTQTKFKQIKNGITGSQREDAYLFYIQCRHSRPSL